MTIYTLADSSVGSGMTGLVAAVVPFAAAIVFLLLSPLLAEKIKTTINRQIAEEAASLHIPQGKVPPHLGPGDIDAYLEYAEDAVQIFPLTLLPVTGAVFAIAVDVPSVIALGYLGLAVVAAVATDAWVLSKPAGKYVTRGIRIYSVSTVIGIASNVLGLAMILVYGP